MTTSLDDQTGKDAFLKYLQYYDKVCCEGNFRVCSDKQVTDEARRVHTEKEPRQMFSTLDLYLYTCAQHKDGHRRIQDFIKAIELLEMFCVNLFLFPWKTEIKTLKTFTGHFVYYIKPILPFAKSILQGIGYSIETDTEFRLSDTVDSDKARRTGFNLFLARLECKSLLELMGQRSHTEFLEILQKRTAPLNCSAGDNVSEQISDMCNLNEDHSQYEGHVEGGPLVNPGEQQRQESPKILLLKYPHDHGSSVTQHSTTADVERPSNSFTSDKSILEMQENYPDLAICQKPIFRKSQKMSLQTTKTKEREHNATKDIADMSDPQSIPMDPDTNPSNRKLSIPKSTDAEAQASEDKPLVLQAGTVLQECVREGSPENCLNELTEQMGKLQTKYLNVNESLKCPIEETSNDQPCGSNGPNIALPIKSPHGMSLPILCSPSQEPVCNITDCDCCVKSETILGHENAIKEPPRSIYIPSSLSELGPPTDHKTTGNGGSNAELHKSPASQQSEDDLAQTFVMV